MLIHKIGLVLLLGLACSNASAEWRNVANYNSMTLYVDSTTIHKKGNMVKMWSLVDFKNPDTLEGRTYRSMKLQNEYDCKEEENRMIYNSYHTGNMGDGEVFSINASPGDMMPVPPNSGNLILWKIACSKH
ncbi:surface-adhesin E family protein [Methylotenera sp.]|uniref:surface-adhesin E family protein n=1 Tax=Methylotenera sp. TaxID=2051956 RepID=UPI0027300127|nr:surface-adhesin E family protein [Methylotenera sp.]MDP2229943.1 hypothetical protein [Methylotenera sp.]